MSTTFQHAPDAIDPALVPQRQLASGHSLPAIGLGTFGSDAVTGEQVATAVIEAAALGYRHFDCASVYTNEHLIGPALQTIMAGGVPREELWITSKLWNDKHAVRDVIPSFKQSMRDLKLDYLDAYLVHWPFPNFHPPGCSVDSRSPDAKPYLHEKFMETWGELEKLVEQGLVRYIGTSNVTVPKLTLILRDARIQPAINEMELHPHFQQPDLFNFVVAQNIVPIGYSPIGSPGRPERDRTAGDTVDIEDPVLIRIAQRLGVHPVAVCLKWAVQRGQVPIPFSVKRPNLLNNLKAVVEKSLTAEDMSAIATIDQNCRLIKGQVFLWKENQSWEDLWDIDGTIPN